MAFETSQALSEKYLRDKERQRTVFDQFKNLKDLAGMLGNMGDMGDMKARMEQAQEELARKHVTGEAGAGAVRVTLNGKLEVQQIKIDPAMLGSLTGQGSDTDHEMVEQLLAAAFNDASAKAQELMKESLGDITGGLNLPGM